MNALSETYIYIASVALQRNSFPPRGGRPGWGASLTIERARILRKNMTDAERRLWHRINRRQLAGAKFRRQQVLGPYIVDFVCLEKRLILEVDGGQHGERVERDNERTVWLEEQGFQVLRFWNNEVLGNIEGVTQIIFERLTRNGA